MSIWSKILGLGAVAATPFTGGTSLAALPAILGGAGAMIGAAGQGAAQNRGATTAAGIDRDRNVVDANRDYETALANRAKLDLDQRATADKLQSEAWKKSLQSALALNWSPAARPKGVANISFVGKGIGEQGRMSAETINRAAQLKLLNGEKFDDLPGLERFTPSELPKQSMWEKIANILGPSLSVAGKFAKVRQDDDGPGMSSGQQNPNIYGNVRF